MVEQKTNQLMGRKRIPASIHAADAVGVAIGHQANIVRMFAEIGRAGGVVLRDRLRIDAAEQRIVLGIKRRDLARGTREQFSKATSADSEQSIVREATL